MNKDYMLAAIRQRIKDLEQIYYTACNNKTLSGKQLSKSGAAVLRSHTKRDICILTLIEELLVTSTLVNIVNDDAIAGFDKLMKE
jgi:hypothetical protein